MKNNLLRKLGRTSLAILLCLADRGTLLMSEIASGKRSSLSGSLERIWQAKDIQFYYEALADVDQSNLRRTVGRLKSKGLIEGIGGKYSITSAGSLIAKNLISKKGARKEWDGKWRIVFFDIPEPKRKHRLWLNYALQNFGYRQLQKSVLIGKFPLDQDIYQESIGRGLQNYIRIMTVGEIDDEKILN